MIRLSQLATYLIDFLIGSDEHELRVGIPESIVGPVFQEFQGWDEPKLSPLRHVEVINECHQSLAPNGGQDSLHSHAHRLSANAQDWVKMYMQGHHSRPLIQHCKRWSRNHLT